ncbi:MAG: DNA repair protein RadC [Bacteroidia bacterium]|jgi:DNA repair protein RadC
MKAVPITRIKKELQHLSQEDLVEIVLRVGKYKVENKELLTYLLFEAGNEDGYIDVVKEYIDEQFELVHQQHYYYIKKSVRKILRTIKKYIKFSKKPETEAALLIHFCRKLKKMEPSYINNTVLTNMFDRQLGLAEKTIGKMHEDLQYDYKLELEEMF